MAVSLPIASFKVPSGVVIERRMFYRPLVRTDIFETVVYNGLAIGLVVAGLGVWGLVIATVVRAVAGTALLLATGGVGFLLPSFSFRMIRPFLSFGLQFQAVNVMNTVRDQGLNLVTAAIGGLSVLGIWSLANRVLQGIMLVFESLWRVSFPAITRLIETGESPQPSIERALALMTTFTGFVVAAIGGTAPALVPVAFGGAWQDAVPVLPWAAAGILLAGPVSTSTVGLLYARGRPGTVLVAVVAHSITWFAVAVPLLPSLGAESLGIGWCVAAIVDVAILGRALAQYRVGVISQCAPTVLLTVAAGVAGWVVATTVRPAGLALAASVLCVEALYLGSMIALRRAVVLDMFRLLRRGMSRGGTVGEPAAS
jgi:O-antigen/teichoic acid export membrane protein